MQLNSPRIVVPAPDSCPADQPVDAFVRNQLGLAGRLMAAITGAFEAIERVSRGTELLTPAVQGAPQLQPLLRTLLQL